MDQSLNLTIQDEEFIFDCRRAIFWPKKQVLLTTDLHWGKTDYFQKHGIAVPDRVFEEDLLRLAKVISDYEVKTMVVRPDGTMAPRGDLIHHEKSLSHGLIERVAAFREDNPCELILIKGNHDRYTEFPESWGIVEEKEMTVGEFFFTHEYREKNKKFQFSGHIHPMMKFKSGSDSFRLPIFMLSSKSCLVPAFSHLTGGQDMQLRPKQKAIAVTDEGLMLFEK